MNQSLSSGIRLWPGPSRTRRLSGAEAGPHSTAFKTENATGMRKAGKNDCASTGNNSCGGLLRS